MRRKGEFVKKYWKNRLQACKSALISNRFDAYIVEDISEAKGIVLERIIPQSQSNILVNEDLGI